MSAIRILLADDHDVVRKGLRYLLQRQEATDVIGEARDGREALKMAEELRPDLVIMDITMPLLSGIGATAQIVKSSPKTKVIILRMYSDETYLVRILTAGAKGYLLKEFTESDLIPAVKAVIQGKPYFSEQIAQTLLEDYMQQLQQRGLQDSYDLLIDREGEVLHLLAEGKSNKKVATLLNLSVYTIETHRTNLMQKLNLHSTAEVVFYAVRKKLIL
jgi:two-component system, NarL family, response regulator NreC